MAWDILAAASSYTRRKRKKAQSVGILVKKSPGGLWLVKTEGREVLASPLTDEPIQVGSRVLLEETKSLVSKTQIILGAVK